MVLSYHFYVTFTTFSYILPLCAFLPFSENKLDNKAAHKRTAMRKYAIYSRKSKFTGKGESIDNQVTRCREYLKLHFGVDDEESLLIFEDEGYSGKNTRRPQFQLLIEACKRKEIKLIICYQLDRISRSVKDFSILSDQLEAWGVGFVSVKESFDTATPMGKAMMMITSVFAQMERENLAERLRDNFHTLAKSGRWLGGTTPLGYKSMITTGSIASNGKVRNAYMLEPIPQEARIVREIFRIYQRTGSLAEVERALMGKKICTRNNIPFKSPAIKSILKNPVYAAADSTVWDYFHAAGADLCFERPQGNAAHGIMAFNKSDQTNGGSHDQNPPGEWIVAAGKHPPLVSGNDWVKVQRTLAQNSSASCRIPKNDHALLSGIICCGCCGSKMRVKLDRCVRPDGTRSFHYLCVSKEKSRQKKCAVKNAPGNLTDEMVCNEIRKLSEDDELLMKKWRQIKDALLAKDRETDAGLKSAKALLRKKEKQIGNLLLALSDSTDSPANIYIRERIDSIHKEKEELEMRIKGLTEKNNLSQHADIPVPPGNHADFSDSRLPILINRLSSFDRSFDSMSVEEKRMVLKALVNKVMWDGEKLELYFSGADGTKGAVTKG